MKDNKIFKIIMVSIAVMSVCGVIIYSLKAFTSKSGSDTVSPEIMYGNILSLYKMA